MSYKKGAILYAKRDLKINRKGVDHFILEGTSVEISDIRQEMPGIMIIYLALVPLSSPPIYPLTYYSHQVEDDWTTVAPYLSRTLWERILQ